MAKSSTEIARGANLALLSYDTQAARVRTHVYIKLTTPTFPMYVHTSQLAQRQFSDPGICT